MDYGYIVRRQSDLVNTKYVLPVCDKPYHMNNKKTTEMGGY